MADNYDDYSREELLRELRLRDRRPRFGLVWERKEIEHEKAVNDDFVALDFDPALSCGDAPYRNLIIEGDNFDALRYLRMTHAGKIKCIYIDPPYNTGNRDFIYNDRFVDKEDAYRHSKWLEFMYRRLQLARDLLAEDGVIFVSIDDVEFAPLKLLLDQTFGEKNRIATLIWQTDGNFDNQARVKICHEYLLVYAFNEASVPPPPVIDPNADESGKLFRDEIRNTIVKNGPKNPVSDILLPIGFPADFEEGEIPARSDKWPHFGLTAVVKKGKLVAPVTISSGWANKKLCESFIKSKFKPVLDTKNQSTTFVLTSTGAIENIKLRKEDQSHVISVIKNIGSVQAAGADLMSQEINFTYPKPMGLIKYLLSMVKGNDFFVMDFFAGSGTTAHAVMKLNAEDDGNRRFILVSSTEATDSEPDKNLCRDVCAERVRRVMQGYTNKKGEAVAGLAGDPSAGLRTGFAYLRTNRLPAETLFSNIHHEAIWTALQLIHAESMSPFIADVLIQQAVFQNSAVLYLPKINEEVLQALNAVITSASTLVVYTWQPGLLRQHFEDDRLSFLPIPQFLVDRFGAGSKA